MFFIKYRGLKILYKLDIFVAYQFNNSNYCKKVIFFAHFFFAKFSTKLYHFYIKKYNTF